MRGCPLQNLKTTYVFEISKLEDLNYFLPNYDLKFCAIIAVIQPTRTEVAHYQFVHGILTDILNLILSKM